MANPEWDNYNPVQRPLVALLMADQFRDDVLGGQKLITIRTGWRDYRIGEKVVLCYCDPVEGWSIRGKITYVKQCQLKEVSLQDLNDDGMASLEDAIAALSQFYDDIDADSLVTVIRWQLI
jgi:hypothetical protein